jgi:hypothetical protein
MEKVENQYLIRNKLNHSKENSTMSLEISNSLQGKPLKKILGF